MGGMSTATLVYSTTTGTEPTGALAHESEFSQDPRLVDADVWPAFCFVCSRAAEHFAEHDDLVEAGLVTYDADGSVRLTESFTRAAAVAAVAAAERARGVDPDQAP